MNELSLEGHRENKEIMEVIIVVIKGRNRYLQLEQKLDFLDIFF